MTNTLKTMKKLSKIVKYFFEIQILILFLFVFTIMKTIDDTTTIFFFKFLNFFFLLFFRDFFETLITRFISFLNHEKS